MSSGSGMVSLTPLRGSRDAYGSWNMNCRSWRSRRRVAPLTAARSVPLNTTWPWVGASSATPRRPSVVLPQPDSPTRPNVSPRRTERSTPLPDPPAQDRAGRDRELLGHVPELEDALGARLAGGCGSSRALGDEQLELLAVRVDQSRVALGLGDQRRPQLRALVDRGVPRVEAGVRVARV